MDENVVCVYMCVNHRTTVPFFREKRAYHRSQGTSSCTQTHIRNPKTQNKKAYLSGRKPRLFLSLFGERHDDLYFPIPKKASKLPVKQPPPPLHARTHLPTFMRPRLGTLAKRIHFFFHELFHRRVGYAWLQGFLETRPERSGERDQKTVSQARPIQTKKKEKETHHRNIQNLNHLGLNGTEQAMEEDRVQDASEDVFDRDSVQELCVWRFTL